MDIQTIEAIEREYRAGRTAHARQLLYELITRERQAAHDAAYTQGWREALALVQQHIESRNWQDPHEWEVLTHIIDGLQAALQEKPKQ